MTVSLEVLTERVRLLEEVVDKIQVALYNMATMEAVRQISLLKERDIDDIQTDIEEIRARLTLLTNEVFK